MTQPTMTPAEWEQILAIARQAAEEIAAEQAATARRAEAVTVNEPPVSADPAERAERERGFAARLAAVLRSRR